MNKALATAIVTLSTFWAGAALAQMMGGPMGGPVNGSTSSPVGPVGVPLGATELAAPGLSPAPSDAMGCTASQTGAPLFDGGGLPSTATVCGQGGNMMSSMPTPPTVGNPRAGIPLGSTEIASPGLSPLPAPITPFVSPPVPAVAPMPSAAGAAPPAGGLP